MPVTWEALLIFVLFGVPGYVSDLLFRRTATRQQREGVEVVLSILLWTVVNYALWSPVLLAIVPRAATAGYSRYVMANLAQLLTLAVVAGLIVPAILGTTAGRVLN